MVLLVGAKLHHIIATLALENAGVQGSHVHVAACLRPRDELFWFRRPKILRWFIHFILFQNAFELATFIWFWWQFSLSSCYLTNKVLVAIRLGLGFAVQILCSHHTLPLYSLVTQMGSNYKQAIFQNEIKEKLHIWRNNAKRRAKLGTFSEDQRKYSANTFDQSVTTRGADFDITIDDESSRNPHATTESISEIEVINRSQNRSRIFFRTFSHAIHPATTATTSPSQLPASTATDFEPDGIRSHHIAPAVSSHTPEMARSVSN